MAQGTHVQNSATENTCEPPCDGASQRTGQHLLAPGERLLKPLFSQWLGSIFGWLVHSCVTNAKRNQATRLSTAHRAQGTRYSTRSCASASSRSSGCMYLCVV